MGAMEIQKEMDDYHYWDARVLELSCNYFADELMLSYEDSDGKVVYKFDGCYKVLFNHDIGYEKEKPIRKLSKTQRPYFIQDVEVEEVEESGIKLYQCQISMPPLNLQILCKEIVVNKLR